MLVWNEKIHCIDCVCERQIMWSVLRIRCFTSFIHKHTRTHIFKLWQKASVNLLYSIIKRQRHHTHTHTHDYRKCLQCIKVSAFIQHSSTWDHLCYCIQHIINCMKISVHVIWTDVCASACTSFSNALSMISRCVSLMPLSLIHRNMPAMGQCHSATSTKHTWEEVRN